MFKGRIVEAVLTIVYSLAFGSFELDARRLLVVAVGCDAPRFPPMINHHYVRMEREASIAILPGSLLNLLFPNTFGDSPDVATAKACIAAVELVRRRDDRDDVTTTPGKTLFNEFSVALSKL